jgi:hypothetical protein
MLTALEIIVFLHSRSSLSLAVYRFSYSNDQLSLPIMAADPFQVAFPCQREVNETIAQIRDLLIRKAGRSVQVDGEPLDDQDQDQVFELILLLDNGSIWRSLLGPWDDGTWKYSDSSKPMSGKPIKDSFLVPVNAGLTPLSSQIVKYPIPKFAQDQYALRDRRLRDGQFERPGYDMRLVYDQFLDLRSSICSANPTHKNLAARDFANIFNDFQQILSGPDHMLDPSATL